MSITDEQARKASFHCLAMIEHSGVATYTTNEHSREWHLNKVLEAFKTMADRLGYRVEKIEETVS